MAVDLNQLLRRNQLSLSRDDARMSPRERRAHDQFAREHAEQMGRTRDALGVKLPPPGPVS